MQTNEDLTIKMALEIAQEALKKEQETSSELRQKLHEATKQSVEDKETIRRLRFVIDQDTSCSTLLG